MHGSWRLIYWNTFKNVRFCHSIAKSRKIDNFQATKLIKNLYAKNGGKNKQLDKQKVIENAFEIFQSISTQKNNFSINTILTFCLRMGCSEKIDLIWDDIQHISQNDKSISECYTLLIMCCIESKNMSKFIQVLSWMEQHQHKLSLHLGHIAKLLNACNPSIKQLKYIESLMNKDLIETNEYIQAALIKGYGKLKDIPSGLNIFNSMDVKHQNNKIIINGLLTSMVNNGYDIEAIELYHRIETSQYQMDNITHYLALKACINLKEYKLGCKIHKSLQLSDTKDAVKIKTQLIDFYGIFGDVSNAVNVFDSINESYLDIVCVGAMLKVLVNNGCYDQVIQLYDKIDSLPRIKKDIGCHVLAIKACANLKNAAKGKEIYKQIPENQRNVNVLTAIIDFYGQCSEIQNAVNLFETSSKDKRDNIVFINSMLTAYVNNGYYDDAVKLYQNIRVDKTDTTHVLAVTACSKGNKFKEGRDLYQNLRQNKNVLVKTSLIDLFGNMKDIKTGLHIYGSIKDENMNIITINAIMTALINNDYNEEAMKIYHSVLNYKNVIYDATSYLMAIKACTNLGNIVVGQKVYESIPTNMINIQIQTALIQLYAECGDVAGAVRIFNNISDDTKTIVTINTMLTAYTNNGYDKQALKLFDEMDLKYKYITKDNVLYSVAIKACTNSNNIDKGKKIHDEIKLKHQTEKDNDSYNNDDTQLHLINMYSKHGMADICDEIFNEMKDRKHEKYLSDINVWNEMINAHLRDNNLSKGKQLLNMMKTETNLTPNHKTFSLLLNGCSHIGDIEEANNIWINDINDDKLRYDSYIIGTMVDTYSRKGLLYQGYEWIYKYELINNKKANQDIDYAMWMSLLHGCRQENNVLLGQYIYKQISDRFKDDKSHIDSAFVLLSNIKLLSNS